MARDLTGPVGAAMAATNCRPVIFFEGEFASGTVRLWSEVGTMEWNGQSWTGLGSLTKISTIEESADVQARGIAVELTGIPRAMIEVALNEARQGKPGKVWIGVFDDNNRLIANPYLAFSGRLDVPEIARDGTSGRIKITYESRLIDLERPRERRYTHEDQQIDYAGDLGFEFVPSLQDAKITWGRG